MLIRKIFMQEYQQKRPKLQMTMLMNAMFAVACRHSDDIAVKQDAAKYFGRAKFILDETGHLLTLPTIQALQLMAYHQESHTALSSSYMYSGMAIRMAYVG